MAHPHAENMRLYLEDWFEDSKPWARWECRCPLPGELSPWRPCENHNDMWRVMWHYRRIPQPVKVEGWVNIHPDMVLMLYDSKKDADDDSLPSRLACKHVSFEYTPGEGL